MAGVYSPPSANIFVDVDADVVDELGGHRTRLDHRHVDAHGGGHRGEALHESLDGELGRAVGLVEGLADHAARRWSR